jgi:uncharacterized protein (TIGR00369 family)
MKSARTELEELMRTIPFNEALGMKVVECGKESVTLSCRLREDLRNVAGVLHGGVTASVADAAVRFAIAYKHGRQRKATTVELKVNYFLPISHGNLFAEARLIRDGAKICVGEVKLYDDQKRLAGAALITYMLLPA